jgi:MerR family transcriptional regulator, copper efflux regulator
MNTMPTSSMRAGEIARLAGVSKDTLRYYERNRLLRAVPRDANGYRWYPAETLQRVALIRRGLLLGFSVPELRRFLATRDSGAAPCKQVRTLAAEKLSDVERRIADLQELRGVLRRTLHDWDRLLAGANGKPAGLLDSTRQDGRLRRIRRPKGWLRKEPLR